MMTASLTGVLLALALPIQQQPQPLLPAPLAWLEDRDEQPRESRRLVVLLPGESTPKVLLEPLLYSFDAADTQSVRWLGDSVVVRAYQLQLAGSLIASPGTGALDDKWAAKPAWLQWSNQSRDTGADAVAAVENRDLAAIGSIGDQLVEVCEGCHTEFKLPFPTGGKFGELSPVPSDVD
jgi:hypothetical protein